MAYNGSGIQPPLLRDEPELNRLVAYLWRWFSELHACRSNTGFGPNPIGWRDLLDWQEVTGNKLAQWEILAIRTIDSAYLLAQGKKK